jgi:hypothetical protein
MEARRRITTMSKMTMINPFQVVAYAYLSWRINRRMLDYMVNLPNKKGNSELNAHSEDIERPEQTTVLLL